MNPETTTKLINSAGLLFDIAGAWLVAIEVSRQYKGKKYEQGASTYDGTEPPYDSEEYNRWEISKYRFMKYGLICLTIGFVLQILSNWPCLFF